MGRWSIELNIFKRLRKREELLPPPHYGYPRPWKPTLSEIIRDDRVQMDCPWCHKETWPCSHSEPVWLPQKYGSGAAHNTGDSICSNCGRGIFFWGMPWIYHAEFDDDGSSETYYSWEDFNNKQPSVRANLQCGPNPKETPLRTWSRSDPDAPTVYTEISKSPIHPCSIGNHQKSWSSSGWHDVEGALVQWVCGRCNIYLGWGKYSDGPGAPYQPAPSLEQQLEWERKGREMQRLADWKRELINSIDVEGECNNRSGGNRCPQPAGHTGPHGYAINGLIFAPWTDQL